MPLLNVIGSVNHVFYPYCVQGLIVTFTQLTQFWKQDHLITLQ
jgi:hypothetical protein